MWLFPFVHKDVFDDVVADLRKQLAQSQAEARRLHDLVYRGQFGVQVFDSIPGPAIEEPPTPAVEETLTPEQETERQIEQEEARDMARLQTIKRTRPSQLAGEMERVMNKRTYRRANLARPKVRPEVTALFEKARQEATQQ